MFWLKLDVALATGCEQGGNGAEDDPGEVKERGAVALMSFSGRFGGALEATGVETDLGYVFEPCVAVFNPFASRIVSSLDIEQCRQTYANRLDR